MAFKIAFSCLPESYQMNRFSQYFFLIFEKVKQNQQYVKLAEIILTNKKIFFFQPVVEKPRFLIFIDILSHQNLTIFICKTY